ncbi:universal stress protein [Mycolicibacterium chlorophenolicum]
MGFHDGPVPRTQPQAALIVGWDAHRASTAALRFSVILALRLTAHIHVVHTADVDDMPIDPDAADWEKQMTETLAGEENEARRLLDELPASWTYHAGHGDPADLLARVADRYSALLVIIGSPRGGLLSLLDTGLGQSVSHRMIGQRRTPLLLVPADTLAGDEGSSS